MTTTTTTTPYTSTTDLTGREWLSHDGVCVVGERMPSGMYRVTRADGRVQQIRPSIIEDAIAKAAASAAAR